MSIMLPEAFWRQCLGNLRLLVITAHCPWNKAKFMPLQNNSNAAQRGSIGSTRSSSLHLDRKGGTLVPENQILVLISSVYRYAI